MRHYERLTCDALPSIIIMANGDYPTHPMVGELLERWHSHSLDAEGMPYTLVCCDGGINKLQRWRDCLPDAVVGDLDSVAPELIQRLEGRIIHIAEQDTNDLSKAMRYIHAQHGRRALTIIGASGGREDHLLGNIALLTSYARYTEDLVMLTDHGYFRLITEDSTLGVECGQQISFFNFARTPISVRGVQWTLDSYVLPELWCGTLNRATEPIITIQTETPILVYVAHMPN